MSSFGGNREIRLRGGSGCALSVMTDPLGQQIVRKTSSSPAYNARLEAQKVRQRRAAALGFPTVEIVSEGITEDGLAFFDMPYLVGLGAHEVLAISDPLTIKDLSDQISGIVLRFSEFQQAGNPDMIERKVSSIKATLNPRHDWFGVDALEELAKWAETANVPSTFCHGDFTLENIIIVRGQAMMLDFHDIFYESWVQDVSKLLFDTEFGWSQRQGINSHYGINAKQRISAFNKLVLTEINPILVEIENRQRLMTAMKLLHLMRLLPYTGDSRTELDLGTIAIKLTRSLRN